MTAGLMFMAFAAIRAQIAYKHRLDGVSAFRHSALSAIIYAVTGIICFIAAKVM